jgi:hypothetical protein
VFTLTALDKAASKAHTITTDATIQTRRTRDQEPPRAAQLDHQIRPQRPPTSRVGPNLLNRL